MESLKAYSKSSGFVFIYALIHMYIHTYLYMCVFIEQRPQANNPASMETISSLETTSSLETAKC